MEPSPILLTGFEPYGGRGLNPANEAVTALDGKYIGPHRIFGVTLPVVNKGLRQRIQEKIETVGPAILLSLGLWPGETMIRLERVGVKTLFIEPGSPWENGYIESFNGKLRDELLAPEQFDTLSEAKVLTERWRAHYNTVRPHSSLGYRAPAPEAIHPHSLASATPQQANGDSPEPSLGVT